MTGKKCGTQRDENVGENQNQKRNKKTKTRIDLLQTSFLKSAVETMKNFIRFFLINCWSSVVASVVLPQFVQSPLFFFWLTNHRRRILVHKVALKANGFFPLIHPSSSSK